MMWKTLKTLSSQLTYSSQASTFKLRWQNHRPNAQSVLKALPCGSATVLAQWILSTTHGLQMAPAVAEKSEMIETGTTDAMIEDTDPGLERGGEIEVDRETVRRSPVGTGATQGTEEGGDIKMKSAMGREIGGRGNEAGVGKDTGRGEVGALNAI